MTNEEKIKKLEALVKMPGISVDEKAVYEQGLKKLKETTLKVEKKTKAARMRPSKVSDKVKQLKKEKEYNDKTVEELVEIKKKKYGNADIESPMSEDEKLLTKIIASKFSEINQEVHKRHKEAQKAKEKEPKKYDALFGDYDHDGIKNIDDPNPLKKGDKETIEEVKLSDEIAALIDFRKEYDTKREEFVKVLTKNLDTDEATILSRTKTPFSIINKLRRKRLTGPNGITDIVGSMVVFSTQKELDEFADKVNAGKFGKVLVFDDYYKKPLAGYKAYHWNLVHDGIPVELQAKTERMKKIASANHTLYKTGSGSPESLAELTDLMEKADKGDAEAQKEIDEIISNKETLTTRLSKKAEAKKEEAKPEPKKAEKKAPEVNHAAEMKALHDHAKSSSDHWDHAKVLHQAQKFESLRKANSQARDEKGDSKKRLTPTRENLIRWMNNPGGFDLIGVDTFKAGDATSDLKIKKEVFWNRFNIHYKH
jgi:hypothetical protein